LSYRVEGHQREAGGEENNDRVEHAKQHADLCHMLARQQIVVGVEAETPQVERGADLERGTRDPADQADGCQQQALRQQIPGVTVERRRWQRDGERQQQEAEPRRILGGVENGEEIGPPTAQGPARRREQRGVGQPGDDDRGHQQDRRHRPRRRK